MFVKLTLLVLGLATVASAVVAPYDNQAWIGVDQLNKYLTDHYRSGDPAKVLEIAQDKLAKIARSESELEHAIQALNTIATSSSCTYEAIQALEYFNGARLDLFKSEKLIATVVAFYMQKLFPDCGRFVESEYDNLKATFEPEVLRPKSDYQSISRGRRAQHKEESNDYDFAAFIYAFKIGYMRQSYLERIYDDLEELTKDEPSDPTYEWKNRANKQENMRHAFNKYLAEPCKSYRLQSNELFDSVTTLLDYLDIGLHRAPEFLLERSKEFQVAMYHNKRCQVVLSLSDDQIKNLKHSDFYVETPDDCW